MFYLLSRVSALSANSVVRLFSNSLGALVPIDLLEFILVAVVDRLLSSPSRTTVLYVNSLNVCKIPVLGAIVYKVVIVVFDASSYISMPDVVVVTGVGD